jgi:hypothetical protein
MKTVQKDKRFVHITDCHIYGLYRKIPKQFGGWKISIDYKEDDNDFFSNHYDIDIDQSKFGQEILTADFKDKERLYYSNGMTDIDIFKQGKNYVIYVSINDGRYNYFFFSNEEFKKLKTWMELEVKE